MAEEIGMGALYLSDADVRALLDIRAVLDVVEGTFRDAQSGRVGWPDPRALRLELDEPSRARYHVKAAALPDLGVTGVRVVGYRVFPDGSGTSRDDNMRYVLLHDPTSGQPLAIVDEHASYGMRSASSGVVAAKYLARSESAIVGLVGAGKLMGAALQGLATLFPLREVRVTSRTAASGEAFAHAFGDRLPGLHVISVATPTEASRAADIVMTATTAGHPLLWERDFALGVFVCALGQNEVAPDAFTAFDKVLVDDWVQARQLADFAQMRRDDVFDRSKLYAELPAVVAGAVPGRTSATERILVRTEGMVTQDIALAAWLYQQACQRGRGLRLP